MYQFADQLVAVGVGVHGEDDDVAEEAQRLGVDAADELVDGLDQLLRAEHLVGVQAAVDPDDRLAFGRERARLIVGEALGAAPAGGRSPCSDRAAARFSGAEMTAIHCVAAFLGPPDVHELHAVGLASSFFQ